MKATLSGATSSKARNTAPTTKAWRRQSTIPALAAVGLTEAAARQKGLAVGVHVNNLLGRFSVKTYAEAVAWSKIIVDRATDRLVGAHFVGHDGQELINVFGLAIKFGITARQLKDHVYAYPTFSADIKHMFAHA